MADTLTPNIKITNQEAGGNDNTWGDIADANFEQIDDKFGDTTSISTTGGTTVLTDEQEIVAIIDVSGTLVSNATIEFSGRGGFWVVKNGTAGSFTLTTKVTGQTGVEIAQGTQALIYCAGTDIEKGNTSDPVAAEATVASAATTNILGAGSEFVAISGTATITSLGTGTTRKRFVRATGAFTLTHNATTLILPTAANIVAAAGDTFIVVADASSNARILAYQRASGRPIALTNETVTGTLDVTGAATLQSTLAVTGDVAVNTDKFTVDGPTGDTVIGGTLGVVGKASFTSTDSMAAPNGTTAQRNGTPTGGDVRYNSTLACLEFYNGTAWIVLGKDPTVQKFTSGTAQTYTPATGVVRIRVRMVGGGGGGGAATSNNGSNGTATSFDTWTADLGDGGQAAANNPGVGGSGGTDGTGTLVARIPGATGGSAASDSASIGRGGSGGVTAFGGGAGLNIQTLQGVDGATNSGAGGSGGSSGANAGAGGGGGEYVEFWVSSPTAVSYTVGAGGAGGAAGGRAGGTGADGIIIIEEFYA